MNDMPLKHEGTPSMFSFPLLVFAPLLAICCAVRHLSAVCRWSAGVHHGGRVDQSSTRRSDLDRDDLGDRLRFVRASGHGSLGHAAHVSATRRWVFFRVGVSRSGVAMGGRGTFKSGFSLFREATSHDAVEVGKDVRALELLSGRGISRTWSKRSTAHLRSQSCLRVFFLRGERLGRSNPEPVTMIRSFQFPFPGSFLVLEALFSWNIPCLGGFLSLQFSLSWNFRFPGNLVVLEVSLFCKFPCPGSFVFPEVSLS